MPDVDIEKLHGQVVGPALFEQPMLNDLLSIASLCAPFIKRLMPFELTPVTQQWR
jgi:hypothetical protein